MRKSIRTLAFVVLLSLTAAVPAGCANNNRVEVPVESSLSEPDDTNVIKIAVSEIQNSNAESVPDAERSKEPPFSSVPEQAPAANSPDLQNNTVSQQSDTAVTAVKTDPDTVPQESSGSETSVQSNTVKPAESSKIPVEATSVSLDRHQLGLNVGDVVQLSAVISPANADSTRIRWYWSDSSVITIDDKCRVTGIGSGTATITVETVNGKKDTCQVTVYGNGTISPIDSPHQTKKLDPIYQPYYPEYDWDAVIAELRKIGEEQYGLVWEEKLWAANKGTELGGPYGACTIEYPARSAKAYYFDYNGKPVFDAVRFRQDCLRMFKDLEKDFSKSRWPLKGRPFRIMVEDTGTSEQGLQDYWVYLLYT